MPCLILLWNLLAPNILMAHALELKSFPSRAFAFDRAEMAKTDFYLATTKRSKLIQVSWWNFPGLSASRNSIRRPTIPYTFWPILEFFWPGPKTRQTFVTIPIHSPTVALAQNEIADIFTYRFLGDSETEKKDTARRAFEDLLTREKISLSELKNKSAKDLLGLSAGLIAKSIAPENVDQLYDLNEHDLTFYLDIGKGDCDKYADLTKILYDYLKKQTGNLEHLYVFSEDLGAFCTQTMAKYGQAHAWVSALSFGTDGNYYVSHIDPTWARDSWLPNGIALDANDSDHIDDHLFRMRVYKELRSPYGVVSEFLNRWEVEADNSEQFGAKLRMVFDALIDLSWFDTIDELIQVLGPNYRRDIRNNMSEAARSAYIKYMNNRYMLRWFNLPLPNFTDEVSRFLSTFPSREKVRFFKHYLLYGKYPDRFGHLNALTHLANDFHEIRSLAYFSRSHPPEN